MEKEKHNWATYRPLRSKQYYIDKTGTLEKGIEAFPSIYIEGAAASGKTTAVRMLLSKHPEIETAVFWMEEELRDPKTFAVKMEAVQRRMEENPVWVVFENLPKGLPAEVARQMIWLVTHLPEESRIIMTGREELPADLLVLLWNRQMHLLPQKTLCLNREEIRGFAEQMKSNLDPSELYDVTGGWAGCVAVMLQLSGEDSEQTPPGKAGGAMPKAQDLRKRYEVNTYIRQQILDTLSDAEQEIMGRGQACPWMNEALCEEVWEIPWVEDVMQGLCRKGLMIWNEGMHHWKVAPLFRDTSRKAQSEKSGGILKRLCSWYGSRGFLREMFWCLNQLNEKEAWEKALEKYYSQVPFLGDSFDSAIGTIDLMAYEEYTPAFCYLRGMNCRRHRNPAGLNRETAKLEEILGMASEKDAEQYEQTVEIYLNLCYVKPELTLDEWLALVEKWLGNGYTGEGIRLYGMQGKSFSCLDGIRDITGLFACSRKEEHRKEKIWKTYLGSKEWMLYQLARMEYYLETERKDAIPEEDKRLLRQIASEPGHEQPDADFRLSALYLLCRLQRERPDTDMERQIENLESILLEDESVCRADAEAVGSLYALWRKEPERLTGWLNETGNSLDAAATEDNFNILYCRAKGFIFLNQYEKAWKILQRLTPYLQSGRHNRFLAEVLFEQAIFHCNMGRRGIVLRSMIESFAVNGSSRYVGFYAEYGAGGSEVLEIYADWLKSTLPEGSLGKKKYNYGNVLRMPEADYMEVLLRCAKRERRSAMGVTALQQRERLTMMETIILRHISRGLNNAQICAELNLKLPTVKSHIYSMYQKLDVNNRVQAIVRAKEMGLID